jgi:hypothetical protein
LTKELKDCHETMSSLNDENVDLKDEIKSLNVSHASTSSIEHVSFCTRCKDIVVDAYVSMIVK